MMSADIRRVRDILNESGGDIELSAGQLQGQLPEEVATADVDLADIIRSGAFGRFMSIDHDLRVVSDSHILGQLMNAILAEQVIEAAYTSITSGPSLKTLSPHHIVEASGRMHVRAYDHGANDFRDFVVNRFDRINRTVTGMSAVSRELDTGFYQKKALVLEINPKISEDRRAMICRDFGLSKDGIRKIRIAPANAIYVKAKMENYSYDYIPPVLVRDQ